MAKGGLLQALAPVLGIGAALAAPEALPALGLGEAAAGGAAEAAPFLIPGTDTALAGAETIPLGTLDTAAGLLGGAGGAEAGAAAPAIADLGATPGLLGADTAAADAASLASPASAAATPALADTATTPAAAGPIGNIAATSAAPTVPAAGLPSGFDPSISPDLTGAGGSGLGLSDFAGGAPGQGGVNLGSFGSPIPDPSALDSVAGSVGDWALTHPGPLLTAGIAGTQLLHGQPTYPAAQSIQGLATPTGTAGFNTVGAGTAGLEGQAATTAGETAALTAPLTTGILPPGLQQTVDQAVQAQKAQVRSTYATQGLTGSTMEASALSQVDANATAQKANIAEGLLPGAEAFSAQTNQAFSNLSNTGATLTGYSLQAYNDLVRTQMQSDQNYQAALYKFAAALAGGGYQPPAANP